MHGAGDVVFKTKRTNGQTPGAYLLKSEHE